MVGHLFCFVPFFGWVFFYFHQIPLARFTVAHGLPWVLVVFSRSTVTPLALFGHETVYNICLISISDSFSDGATKNQLQ